MSIPRLPPELLDHIIDLLYDSQTALGNCCLVSKSWIPSTRSHIFANVKIVDEERLRSWKEIFPDPSTSPARYAKTLTIDIQVAATADAEAGGWIIGFSYVERLALMAHLNRSAVSPPVPRILTGPQNPLHGYLLCSVLANFRLHLFISTSRGPGCGHG